ncbi:BamA/OMP85 family outer membrane protein [Sorangium sp. So ce1182]|uniref:BamA/OMP85 family outer membrane protein n=1 Tax=Sorangium sp. So ce1182 TaxID=3133334 RepID=UPI003F63ADF1
MNPRHRPHRGHRIAAGSTESYISGVQDPLARTVAAALVTSAALGVSACTASRQPPPCTRPDLSGCAIEDVSFEGGEVISGDELADRIATAESSHLLSGAFEHVPILSIWDALTVEYERFDRFVLERDMARIERYYRARGFYNARARAARVQRAGGPDKEGRVRVRIVVSEGEPVKVASVDLQWRDWTLEKGRDIARPVTEAKGQLKVGERLDEDQYEELKKTLLRVLTDRGFAYATVEGHVDVDVVKNQARVRYTIELGPECTFGKVNLKGLGELPEAPVRTAIGIEEGERFSTAVLAEAEQALADFGVFGAVAVKPELAPPGQPRSPVVPVTFSVEPAALRAVRLGGGAEVGSRIETHLVAGWEDRNFLGGLRRLNIEARPGLVFYPLEFSSLFGTELKDDFRLLPEIQLRSELRQPGAIERRTAAVLRGSFKLYCPQTGEYCNPPKPTTPQDAEQQEQTQAEEKPEHSIVGYREYIGSIGLERPFLKSDLNASLLYNVQLNSPFTYNPAPLPAGFGTIFIPYLQALVSYDRRLNRAGKPDRLSPHHGYYVSLDAQLAGYLAFDTAIAKTLVGKTVVDANKFHDARDIRLQPEFRGYLPVSRKLTLGFRLMTGWLFPTNPDLDYGEASFDPTRCDTGASSQERAQCGADLQLMQFRGFFSGGATSNRGYGYNEVGPHARVPSPTASNTTDGTSRPEAPLVPIGGRLLWETSLELRMQIGESFGTVVFLDAGDVTREHKLFRSGAQRPHLSAGVGLRYVTPVGPLRLDVGYRVPCMQVIGMCYQTMEEAKKDEKTWPDGEGNPSLLFNVLPIAVNLAIGEAF